MWFLGLFWHSNQTLLQKSKGSHGSVVVCSQKNIHFIAVYFSAMSILIPSPHISDQKTDLFAQTVQSRCLKQLVFTPQFIFQVFSPHFCPNLENTRKRVTRVKEKILCWRILHHKLGSTLFMSANKLFSFSRIVLQWRA